MSNFIRLLVARIAAGTWSCEALATSPHVADEAASLTSYGLTEAKRHCLRILKIDCRNSPGRGILALFALQSSIGPSDEEKPRSWSFPTVIPFAKSLLSWISNLPISSIRAPSVLDVLRLLGFSAIFSSSPSWKLESDKPACGRSRTWSSKLRAQAHFWPVQPSKKGQIATLPRQEWWKSSCRRDRGRPRQWKPSLWIWRRPWSPGVGRTDRQKLWHRNHVGTDCQVHVRGAVCQEGNVVGLTVWVWFMICD